MSNCYKTDCCKESHCIEQKEVCYITDDCKFDYCVDPATNENGNSTVQETGTYDKIL